MKQMSKRARTGLIGLAALLLVSCGLCMIIFIIAPDPEQAEQSATAAVVKQATAAPNRAANDETDPPAPAADKATSATPVAESTAVPPTEAPQPTATLRATSRPRPTATPRSTATPNAAATDAAREAATLIAAAQTELLVEMAYAEAIVRISKDYKNALDGVATQSEAASENPYVIMTDDWKLTTGFYLAAMQLAGDEVRELEPPTRFVAVHADLLEAAGYYDLVARYYAEGVDTLDAGKLELATVNMQLGSEAIQRATAKLEALAGE